MIDTDQCKHLIANSLPIITDIMTPSHHLIYLFRVLFLFQVLIDTKSVQKEINQLSGKLDRTFMVTDELIFRVNIQYLKWNYLKSLCILYSTIFF